LRNIVVRRFAILGLFSALVLAVAAVALKATGFADAFSVVARAADLHGPLRRVADLGLVQESERLTDIPVADGSIRARLYVPLGGASRQTVLLVSGLHPAGIDEPRLIAFSRELAKSGITVVTPEVPGLRELAITPALTDGIERAGLWLATEAGLAHGDRIGLIGISFSGGLAVVAAGRRSLRDHVLYVLSLGGHDDLPRVLRYLCTGIEAPRGPPQLSPHAAANGRPPHDYGLAIVLMNVAERLVPVDQVDGLRSAVRRFIRASSIAEIDKSRADEEFAAIRSVARVMPEPSAALLQYLNDRDVVHLGARLLPYVGDYGHEPALSPSHSPKPIAPVFLLHGRDDNVIPAVESQHLADDLRGHARVRILLTELVSHAEADRPARPLDVLKLIVFWRDVLAQTTARDAAAAARYLQPVLH
jgi:dienelactone hydrolase